MVSPIIAPRRRNGHLAVLLVVIKSKSITPKYPNIAPLVLQEFRFGTNTHEKIEATGKTGSMRR
jgi:hypothetical protein